MIVVILMFIKAYVYLEIRSLIGKIICRMECHIEVAVCYWSCFSTDFSALTWAQHESPDGAIFMVLFWHP